MKILVTGGTGFTGTRVLPLLRDKAEIRVFARETSDTRLAKSLGYQLVYGDLGRPGSLRDALQGCEGLINIASLGFGHAGQIVDAAEQARIRRALFVSTTALFTRLPAKTKAVRMAAEARIQASRLAWTILRPTMIYGGSDDRNMIRLIRFLKRSPLIPVPGDGESLMQPIHVEDLARAIVDGFFAPVAIGKAYNLSGAEPLSFNQIIDETAQALGLRRYKLHIPMAPVCFFLRNMQKLVKRLPLKEEQILRLAEDKKFSHEEAVHDFGFQGIGFAEGIRREIASLTTAAHSDGRDS